MFLHAFLHPLLVLGHEFSEFGFLVRGKNLVRLRYDLACSTSSCA